MSLMFGFSNDQQVGISNCWFGTRKIFLHTYLFNRVADFLVSDLMTPSPPPPIGVENVKNRKNSEKIRGPPGVP